MIKELAKANLRSVPTFFSEARALYAGAHPNVVEIHYACEDADNIYLAMPYYRRGSVKGLMNNGHLSVREIITLTCQVVSALHYIHSKQLVHFDIKPDNILLSNRGEALLGDFGLAKQMINGLAGQQMFYHKMTPPEVTRGAIEFDQTYDIYQLGLTMYRMCNGNAAFYEQHARYILPDGTINGPAFARAVRDGTFPDRQAFQPHIPHRLRAAIRKCLEVNPNDRFRSALEVANQLATVERRLDWRFSANRGRREWRQNKDGTSLVFTVGPDASTTLMKTVGNGAPRRVKAGCLNNASDRDIQRILEEHS